MIEKLPARLTSENKEWPSGLALNLNFTNRKLMEHIFEADGFKVNFALKYTELDDPSKKPGWIKEIEDFLVTKVKPTKPSKRPQKQ
ncbi:hypothetical protein [Pseudomonas yangonensis]|uniref:hypothetical protein n=1 Tax=Pseudomonas yangonensis TaxID=2579922 RepID=UPI001379C5B0|nr:hypothetical protein [Pseudomonas yangonensis]